ncbi:DUF4282 domain-containing protein [Herbaspirillum autotrophicum]|uniref:DUF4282 domain-containing protein n=1 Tax=Herbaspirillum autotrophicum TaxID=180195 RepID=UPI00067E237D|nr:DUF4282 domain-containing protein [Herbaspirillum autotrophicum]
MTAHTTVLSRIMPVLAFDHLIAPLLIKLIYWIGLVAIISAGIGILFSSANSETGPGALMVFGSTILALLVWRLLNELLILMFNIYEKLVDIRNLLSTARSAQDLPLPSESATHADNTVQMNLQL